MPERDKSFIRKAIESLALRLILFIASLAGATVLAWYTANSAWVHGIPGYKVGLIMAALFALCSIGTYFLILTIARIPLRNAPAGSFLEPQENWLREIAERDRLEMHNSVWVIQCTVQEASTPGNAHVTFDIYIRNGSVYGITVDPNIKGFINLNHRRLTGEITISRLPHNLQPRWNDKIALRQELSAEDIAAVRELDSAMPQQGFYDFGNLNITIRGNCPTGDAFPARLRLGRVTRRLLHSEFELT